MVVILIGIGVGYILRGSAPIGRDVGSNIAAQILFEDGSPSKEVEQPTLTLVVFADYQCSACKLAHPAMEAAVRKDGHVRIVYKDWPIFGVMSERAARIAIAADRQGIYPAVHGLLMNERRPLNDQVVRQAITTAGGSWTKIERDLLIHATDIDRQLELNRKAAFNWVYQARPPILPVRY